MSCETDSQCNGTKVCFVGLSWLPEGQSECGCDRFYGWTGDECQDLGPVTYFSIASIAIQLIIAALGSCISMIAIVKFLQRFTFRLDSTILTLVQVTAALVTFFIGRCAGLYVLLTPEQLTKIHSDEYIIEQKELENRKYHIVFLTIENLFIGISLFFSILVACQVCLLWLELATKRFRLKENPKAKKFRLFIYLLEIIWALASFTAVKYTFIVVYLISIPIVCTLAITFLLGRKWVLPILTEILEVERLRANIKDARDAEASDTPEVPEFQLEPSIPRNRSSNPLNEKPTKVSGNKVHEIMISTLIYGVKVTCVIMVLGMFIILISGGLYAHYTLNDQREFTKEEGVISGPLVANEIIYVGVLLSMFTVSHFSLVVVKARPIERLRSRIQKNGREIETPSGNGGIAAYLGFAPPTPRIYDVDDSPAGSFV